MPRPPDPIASDDPRVLSLVDRTTVIDMLGLLTLDWDRLRAWQRKPTTFGLEDFRRLVASGVDVFHPAVDPNSPDPHAAALGWMEGWNQLLRGQSAYLRAVRGAADLDPARSDRRIGILLGFQTSEHFRTVEDVERFHALGQRVSQLTYNDRCRLAQAAAILTTRGSANSGGRWWPR